MIRFLIALFFPLALFAQNVTNIQVGQRFSVGTNISNIPSSGGGIGNVWTLITNISASATAGGTATTSAVNAIGAKLIVIEMGDYDGVSPGVSDSQGNAYTQTNTYTDLSGFYKTTAFYIINPTVTSSMTFSGVSDYTRISVLIFGLSSGTITLDRTNGYVHPSGVSQSTFQPGSMTALVDHSLYIVQGIWSSSATASIDSSFSIPSPQGQGQESSDALWQVVAWKEQTTAGALNPTITLSAPATAISAHGLVFGR